MDWLSVQVLTIDGVLEWDGMMYPSCRKSDYHDLTAGIRYSRPLSILLLVIDSSSALTIPFHHIQAKLSTI